jgi:hypothetical protein
VRGVLTLMLVARRVASATALERWLCTGRAGPPLGIAACSSETYAAQMLLAAQSGLILVQPGLNAVGLHSSGPERAGLAVRTETGQSRQGTHTGWELMGWSWPWHATIGPCGPPAASALHVDSFLTTNAGSGTMVVRFSCLQKEQFRPIQCSCIGVGAITVVPDLPAHLGGPSKHGVAILLRQALH